MESYGPYRGCVANPSNYQAVQRQVLRTYYTRCAHLWLYRFRKTFAFVLSSSEWRNKIAIRQISTKTVTDDPFFRKRSKSTTLLEREGYTMPGLGNSRRLEQCMTSLHWERRPLMYRTSFLILFRIALYRAVWRRRSPVKMGHGHCIQYIVLSLLYTPLSSISVSPCPLYFWFLVRGGLIFLSMPCIWMSSELIW